MKYTIRVIPFREITESGQPEKWAEPGPVPITPERAASQARNPSARPEDPCLWVAHDADRKVIGFAGSLPAWDVHNEAPMGWNSCWWADPDYGREAALPLLYSFISHWKERVAFADMTERTHAIIKQLGICHTREDTVLQIYYRFPVRKILEGNRGISRFFMRLFVPAMKLCNRMQDLRLRIATGGTSELNLMETGEPDTEAARFMKKNNSADFSRRSMDEFNWALSQPWLVEELPENAEVQKRYPFSYTAREFRIGWLKTSRGGELTSLMLISERNGVLKVLYYFGSAPEDGIAALRQKIARNRGLYSLLIAHPELLRAKRPAAQTALYLKKRTRYIGISRKILPELPDELVMQLGDGDALFT